MISQTEERSGSCPKSELINMKAMTMPKSTVWLMASLVSDMPRRSRNVPNSAPDTAMRLPTRVAVYWGLRRKAFSSSLATKFSRNWIMSSSS